MQFFELPASHESLAGSNRSTGATDGDVPSLGSEHLAIFTLPPTPNLATHSGWAVSASGIP
jgi:hypothetical protein